MHLYSLAINPTVGCSAEISARRVKLETCTQRVLAFANADCSGVVVNATDEEDLDTFFYCTHHPDLKGLSAREARRHYRRRGRRERRLPNSSAMLRLVEAQEAPLPADFDSLAYLRLNGDLQHELRHAWQPAEHYLRHGRHHGRRYKPQPAGFTDRSQALQLRRRLVQVFGEPPVTEALVFEVHKAASLAMASTTPAAPLMDPVLIARWLLSSSEMDSADLANLQGQLGVLFKVAFEPFPILPRSAAEMEAINRVRATAIATSVCGAGPDRPPVTLLMLAAQAASGEPVVAAPKPSEAAGRVARFFARDVPHFGLQRYVTPAQRGRLRAPVSPQDPRPLAACLLDEVLTAPSLEARDDPADLATRFFDRDVWLSDMDYVLSGEQLTAAQVQVTTQGDHVGLSAPSFLFQDHLGASDEVSWAAREAAQAWLHRFVWREREDRGLPQTIVGASASAYASGAATPKAPKAPEADRFGARKGRKLLRVGELAAFGAQGAGRKHLIGRGWHRAEMGAHIWSADNAALIAIDLDEEDLGPLDLFMRLSPGPKRDPQVTAWWNGAPVGALRPPWNRIFTLHCHLGSHHRSGGRANILCLGVEDTFQVEGDGRRLGVAVYDLMLVRR